MTREQIIDRLWDYFLSRKIAGDYVEMGEGDLVIYIDDTFDLSHLADAILGERLSDGLQ